MAVSYLAVSTVCMFSSFLGLQWWAQVLIGKFKDDGLTVENLSGLDTNASQLLDLLLSSSATVLLLATFIVSVFTLVVLLLKVIRYSRTSSVLDVHTFSLYVVHGPPQLQHEGVTGVVP
ncbi:hypothetical protein MLD38_033590 [Melastoma candidum]|uniref:Uncharacterized protein n=1 Tax=Melastoma candidum TaxID=119954 RepID=A0ACB9MB01_9MYRT|nr:hypothetical protein MLD38_033590 [Melastoma candidum]